MRYGIVDIGKLATGQVLAQIASIITIPIITRQFGPDVLGKYAAVLAAASIIVPIASFRYEQAIFHAKREAELRALMVLCFSSVLVTAGLTLIVGVVLWAFFQPSFLGATSSTAWMLLPAYIFVTGLLNVVLATMSRRRMFGWTSAMRMATTIVGQVSKILFGAFSIISEVALFFTNLIAVLLALILGYGALRTRSARNLGGRASGVRLKFVLRKYLRYPKYNAPAALLASVSSNSILIISSLHYSSAVLGNLLMVKTLITIPVTLLGSAVGEVVFQRLGRSDNVVENTARIVSLVLTYSVPTFAMPFVFLMIDGAQFVPMILGKAWGASASITAILAPLGYVMIITALIGSIFQVLRRQKEHLLMSLVLCSSQVVILLTGSFLSLECVLSLYVAFSCLILMIGYGWLLRSIRLPLQGFAGSLLRIVAPMLVVSALSRSIVENIFLVALIDLAAGLLVLSYELLRLRRATPVRL